MLCPHIDTIVERTVVERANEQTTVTPGVAPTTFMQFLHEALQAMVEGDESRLRLDQYQFQNGEELALVDLIKQLHTRIATLKQNISADQNQLKLYQRLVEYAPCSLWLADGEGEELYINPAWTETMGLSLEQTQKDGWVKRVCIEDRDRMLTSWRHACATGQPYMGQARFIDVQNQVITMKHAARPIYDNGGNITSWVGYDVDITQQVQAEELLRLVTDNVPAMISYVDKEGRYQFNNAVYEQRWGVKREELKGKRVADILGEQYAHLADYVEQALSGTVVEYDTKVDFPGKQSLHMQVRYVPHIDDQGTVQGFFAVINDVSRIKETEKQLREQQQRLQERDKENLMGEMAATIAHELNQPIASVINYAKGSVRRLQSRTDNIEHITEGMDQCVLQAERAARIVQWVRDFINKETDQPVQCFDINQLITRVIGFLQLEIAEKSVQVSTQLADACLKVDADVSQLEQVLVNLLLNAMSALEKNPQDERHIALRSYKNDKYVFVEVENNGQSISPELLERVFEPFFTTKSRGMGMGLTISKRLIEMYGGRLEICPSAQGGVCFRIRLLLAEEG